MDPIVKETFGSDRRQNKKGCDVMAATESVTIKVPVGMSKYLKAVDSKNGAYQKCTFAVPVYIKSDYIAWRCGGDFGNQKIGVD